MNTYIELLSNILYQQILSSIYVEYQLDYISGKQILAQFLV